MAGALVAGFAPQQRGQLIARVGAPVLDREVGQQGLGLLSDDVDGFTVGPPGFETPEHVESKSPNHGQRL